MKDRSKYSFPPPSVSDLDRKSAGRVIDLATAVRSDSATLVIGAGASASAGLPQWRQLLIHICQVFVGHWDWQIQEGSAGLSRPPKDLSIAIPHVGEWWTEDILAAGEEFSKGDPLLAAQQIKNCIRDLDWFYLLRKALYNSPDEKPINTTGSMLLDQLARLCAQATNVRGVINYNYDDVLEDYLRNHRVRFSVLWDGSRRLKRGSIPVYHVHGYMQRRGGPKTKLILAESEYHEEIAAPYSWGNLIQTAELSRSTCIFVGASMTDPNLRRLLRASLPTKSGPHYAFLPKASGSSVAEMRDALFDRDLEKLGVAAIRYPLTPIAGDEHRRLVKLISLLTDCTADESVFWI